MTETTISVDEFQALEHKVLRAIDVVRRERELRATAEAELAQTRELLDLQSAENTEANARILTLTQEREAVRQRVEKMLSQMDELL